MSRIYPIDCVHGVASESYCWDCDRAAPSVAAALSAEVHITAASMEAAIQAAVREEREACAKVAETWQGHPTYRTDIAAAIRARGAR